MSNHTNPIPRLPHEVRPGGLRPIGWTMTAQRQMVPSFAPAPASSLRDTLDAMNRDGVRAYAREAKLVGYSKLNKAELIEALVNA